MTLIEEIEMIANFMGYEGQHEDWCGNNILIDDDFSVTGKTMIAYNPNINWSQLMPVVEKIHTSMSYRRYNRDIGVEITIKPLYCSIHLPDVSEGYDYVNDCWYAEALFSTSNSNYGTTIKCVYDSVIYYLKWYNEKHQGETKS